MTTPNDSGVAQQPTAAEAPVPQPLLLPTDAADPGEGPVSGDGTVGDTAPAARPSHARRAGSTTVLLVISAMIATGGVGFALGRASATGQSGTGQTTEAAANGLPGGQGGAPAMGAIPSGLPAPGDRGGNAGADLSASTISGTVVSVTLSSITIRLAGGQTATVAIDSSTAYHAQTTASSADVTVGSSVIVQTSAPVTGSASASASPGAADTRTATDVTVTAK